MWQTFPVVFVNIFTFARFHGWAPGKKDTLTFEAGEEIDVLTCSDPEWWEGKSRKTGKRGYFPRNHAEVLDERKSKGPLQVSLQCMGYLSL